VSRQMGSVSDMPAGSMAGLDGQPGVVLAEMPSGAMTSEASMTSTAAASTIMPDGKPGVQGEMPGGLPTAAIGAQGDMPAAAMAEGRPGAEGDMPTGEMEGAPAMAAEEEDEEDEELEDEEPVLEVTGEWQLTFWVTEVTRS